MQPLNIAIFASGSGSNAENITTYLRTIPDAPARVALIICNKAEAGVFERARRLDVEAIHLSKSDINNPDILLPILRKHDIDMIVLAGFLLMAPDFLIDLYGSRRIINIHPALLPRHGGRGMYGHHVHEAVVADGDTESGITIHCVSNVCDGGEIICQARTPILPSDGPAEVEAKVRHLEARYFPPVVAIVAADILDARGC